MSQADVPTLTAALLGAPIPAMSEGGLPAVLARATRPVEPSSTRSSALRSRRPA